MTASEAQKKPRAKHVVATVGEIAPGGHKLVELQGRQIGVFNVKGEFLAISNRCPHQGGSLCHGKLVGLAESEEPVWVGTSPESMALADEALRAIRHLPGAYRETLILRLVEGLSGPEIAALTGLTPSSVRVNLHRGMSQLRQALGVSGQTEGEE